VGSRVSQWNYDVNYTYKTLVSWLAFLRRLPGPALVSFFLFFAAAFADGVLVPFFALWAHDEGGISTARIGLLFGCYAGGELLATPLVGGIADRLGRRPVLLASTAGVGAGFLLLYLSRGAIESAASLLFIGVFESVLHPTAATVISDVAPPGEVRTYFSLSRVASSAGHVAGPAIGALLVRGSIGLVFVGSAASLLTASLIVALFLSETGEKGSVGEEDDDDSVMALGAVFRDTRLASLLIPILLLQVCGSWIESVLPLFANHAGSLSPSGVGLLFTYAGILGVCFQLPIVRATAGSSGFALVTASGLALATAFGFLSLSAGLPFLVAAISLLAFSEMLSGPLIQSLVNELAPRSARATYQAALSVVNDVRDTAGPAVGTWLYATAAALPWLTGMPVALAATVVLAWVVRRHETAALVTDA
jgi:MFS family permease